jgi:hypothetical protein
MEIHALSIYGYNETVIRFSNLVKCVLYKLKQIASIYMNNLSIMGKDIHVE